MKVTNKVLTATKANYVISASSSDLEKYKQVVASNLAATVKVPGFRPGKAPTDMVIKHADQTLLQNEFLNYGVNDLYLTSQKDLELRVVGEPEISVTKFVPFTTLEISVEVPIIKDVKLPDYRNLKFSKTKTTVSKEQLDLNLKELQKRLAELKPVKRAAKEGDLVVLDFDAEDFKTKESLPPASAKDFRLSLGDNTLIPGFEDKVAGLKPGESKSFSIVFPKDYHDKTFVQRKVTFKVSIKEVNEVKLPKLDDAFAKQVGPFKSLEELKTELRRQLQSELDRQSIIDLENKVLNELAEKTEVKLDDKLVESEFKLLLDDAKQSAVNRGQTWNEFLASRGETEEQYLKQLKQVASTRIKGGLAIGEIAKKEDITVSEEELEQQVKTLKAQYTTDEAMMQELDKQENRREIGMRLLTEKVLDFIQNT
jgi:trigger factor